MGAKDSVMGKLLGNTQKFDAERVAQTINMLLEHAHGHRATDIHIEPRDRFLLVRYRIDGVLRGVHKLPLAATKPLLTQLKRAAHLNTAVADYPQEGHYVATIDGQAYNVSIGTLPVIGGEKVVLRLKPQAARLLPIEALGLWGENLHTVRASLRSSRGLILVAGPKQSGKTTSLYSLLHVLTTPLISSASIEDPIEHRLSGVMQTEVHPRKGVTFTEGLQGALHQDANVIMLSNLSDKQTIDLAIHASNGGHLILAGVSADSAPRAVLQLMSAGGQPFLLGSALRLVIGQRLVRRLCPQCKQRYTITADQQELLNRAFNLKTIADRKKIHALESSSVEELGGGRPLNSDATHITSLWQASPDGCKSCDRTGYQGQVVLSEVMHFPDSVRDLLQHLPSAAELQAAAQKHGFITVQQDGLIKALRGQTTIEEVLRLVPLS
jgi:type II secretory ATPase GspE/PulE/Tfp pilus assembly ATPase PilB-like protein